MKNKEYKALKNLIHNEFKLSKDDVIKILKEAAKDEAKSQVKRFVEQNPEDVRIIIRDAMLGDVKSYLDGRVYNSDRKKLLESVGEKIVDKLKFELKND